MDEAFRRRRGPEEGRRCDRWLGLRLLGFPRLAVGSPLAFGHCRRLSSRRMGSREREAEQHVVIARGGPGGIEESDI